MRKYLVVFVVVLFSCNNQDVTIPDYIIRRDTMVNMLIDVQIIEAGISVSQLHPDSLLPATRSYYAELFKKYNTSQKRFNQSVTWYSKNTKIFEKLLGEVLIKLMQNQSSEQHKLDSMIKKKAANRINNPNDEE